MAANDLIGPQYDPSGNMVGLNVRAGDVYVPQGFGVVMQVADGTYWRLSYEYVNGTDSTDGVNPIMVQMILS